MKLTVAKNSLQEALQKLTSVIGSRTTLPVLANVLMEAEENCLTLTTTDLEIRITTKIEATVEREGKTTLPAKKLQMFVGKFIGKEVSMDTNENHHTEIKCGSYSGLIYGLSEEDFPLPIQFTPIKQFKLPEEELSRILDQISYAVSLDDSRKVLHGILLSIKENTFTAVATDGKRLALVEKILDNFTGEDGDSILPIKSATELKRLVGKGGEVSIEIGENQILFDTGKSILTSKLIEGNYPNYRQVIPASFSKSISISAQDFLSRLDLVAISIADSGSFIKLNIGNNMLQFDAASSEVGEAKDVIEIDYNDTEINISFNPAFLADPFRHVSSDNVSLKLNDGFSPVGIEGGDGFLYVIMPMRNK